MSDFLYYLFIFPLETLLAFLLECILKVVRADGIGIALLSLLINCFLLKIFTLTDQRTAFETKRKKEFDNLIRSWKRVHTRAKVFAFTQTLYRQNHYHPIYALSALGGLLIQLPFFYAMYFVVTAQRFQVLGNVPLAYLPLTQDLDARLGFHFLPVLMTIITLGNVFLSSKEKSARIQGFIIAILFLILLYDMPSALVLYWTCNMIFSFLRTLFFQNKKNSLQKIFNPNIFSYRQTAFFAILNIAFLICFFTPISLYQSDIHQFDISQTFPTLTALFGFFLLFSFIIFYLFNFIPKKFNKITALILSFILFLGLLNTFIFVGNYGSMNQFVLEIAPNSYPPPPFIFESFITKSFRHYFNLYCL